MTSMIKKPDAEFGKSLIAAAKESHMEDARKGLLSRVSKLFYIIEKCEERREKLYEVISLAENQIKAIESGEFTLSPAGEVKFNDKSISATVIGKCLESSDPSFCPTCGNMNTEDR